MNKKYIKFILSLISVLISFVIFIVTRYENSRINSLGIPLSFVFALPIFMHYKYKKFKNTKFNKIYLIILILLYILCAFILSTIEVSYLYSMNNIFSLFNSLNITLIFMTLSWLILFFEFDDLSNECINTDFYLTLLVSITIILIHINYCLNQNLNVIDDAVMVEENAIYLIQNYSYFSIMYIVALINKVRKHW